MATLFVIEHTDARHEHEVSDMNVPQWYGSGGFHPGFR
jgi:hypothetical protein